jgi:hypothetical protein
VCCRLLGPPGAAARAPLQQLQQLLAACWPLWLTATRLCAGGPAPGPCWLPLLLLLLLLLLPHCPSTAWWACSRRQHAPACSGPRPDGPCADTLPSRTPRTPCTPLPPPQVEESSEDQEALWTEFRLQRSVGSSCSGWPASGVAREASGACAAPAFGWMQPPAAPRLHPLLPSSDEAAK